MKINFKLLTFVAVFALLAFVPLALAQKGSKPDKSGGGSGGKGSTNDSGSTIQVEATFADVAEACGRDEYGNPLQCKLRSDGQGPYTSSRRVRGYSNLVALSGISGYLYMQIHFEEYFGRHIVFQFDTPARTTATDPLVCNAFKGIIPPTYTRPAPEYVTTAPYIAPVIRTRISSGNELVFDGGKWQRKVVQGNEVLLNLLEMPQGDTRYAELLIIFEIEDPSPEFEKDVVYLGFNNNFQRELLESGNTAAGVVQVTHPSDNTWVMAPVPFPPPTDTLLGEDQAVNWIYDLDLGGNCDLGDYYMPFELTITRP
jgi:hypothetical protein